MRLYNGLKRLQDCMTAAAGSSSGPPVGTGTGRKGVETHAAGDFHATAARGSKDSAPGDPAAPGAPGGPRWQRDALRRGEWEVYYDGDCGFCRRWAGRAARFSHPLIRWRNFRALSPEQRDAIAHLNPRFDQAAYVIIAHQLALPGFAAFRQLALASPRLWPLLPLAYFPGSSWLGPKLYQWIARRYGPTSKHAPCQLP